MKIKNKKEILKSFFLMVFFLFICSNHGFSIEPNDVKNFSYYLSFYNGKVTLKNGIFRQYGPPDNIVDVKIERYELKDLNHDGINDAVVILVGNYGGSGAFYELTVLLSKGKDIVQTNSVVLGDRIKIEKIFVYPKSRSLVGPPEIEIFALTHKDSDASAFPSKKDVICYSLVKEKLIPCEETPIVKKPALYLYPEKKQTITVRLAPKGDITKTIPPYNGKWIVKVTPTGKINNQYDYLFYEVNLAKPYPLTNAGWVVPYSELSKWFDIYLPKLGLNEKEADDFKNYWLKELKPHKYYEIRYMDKKFLSENLHVDINPKPDTFIRVFLHFKGTNSKQSLTEPQIFKKNRRGFTAVEWGGINTEESERNFSFLATDLGELILREIHIKEHKLYIRVNSKGCTDKSTLKAEVINSPKRVDKDVQHYEITFLRIAPDYCKALFPDGVMMEYDLRKDFGINTKLPYTISVKNLIYPLLPNEPYFEIFPRIEEPIPFTKDTLKEDLIKATIKAIDMEIERYEKSSHSDKKEKISYLQGELKRFKEMSPDSYKLEGKHQDEPLLNFNKFGTLMPPIKRTIEIHVTEPLKVGDLLYYTGMTKSGPFYHLAGISDKIAKAIEKGTYKVKIYLIYKREYFGFIPNYYVFLSDLAK